MSETDNLKALEDENLILRRALQQAVKQLMKLPDRTLYDVFQLEEWDKISKCENT